MARSVVRNSVRNSRRQAYPHQGSSTLPRANLVVHIKNYPFVDRIGKHDGPAQLMQYAEVVAGTVTLYHPGITGAETIASSGGDAPVSVVAGGIVIGVGKAWSIKDSAGHHWTHCSALSPTSVVFWDVSEKREHVVAEGLAEAVVTALCSTSRDLTIGTDWLDHGFTLADGNQYLHPVSGGLIPTGLAIPKLESVAGCCAFVVGG